MSNSLSYNSVDFGGANYGLVVDSNRFVDMPEPRINRDMLAQSDGEVAQGSTFNARSGPVSGIVFASSFANLKTQRDNIEAALAVGQEGVKALTFDAFSGKSWQARVISVNWSDETPVTIRCTVVFYAPDPWPIATSSTELGDTLNDGGGNTVI